MRSGYVRKDEPIAINDFADLDGDRPAEHRPVLGKRMKLAALAAFVDAQRKFVQQRAIELAAGE